MPNNIDAINEGSVVNAPEEGAPKKNPGQSTTPTAPSNNRAEGQPEPVEGAPQTLQRKTTGLPDKLKSGIENLSGMSMDDVKVHYNSDKPASLQAHAYAQGTDIHIAPGQEKHLPHEAWHVVQQKQGRVQATTQLKGAWINDCAALEREADHMGAQAKQAAGLRREAQVMGTVLTQMMLNH